MNETLLNVAAYLPEMAAHLPFKRAIVAPVGRDRAGRVEYAHLTFQQLNEETDRYAHGLEDAGIARGTRTILMVRPSIEFFVLTFALYKIGAVPVLIDPGMGRLNMVDCLRKVDAEAFIGIPLAHLLRRTNKAAFRSIRINIVVGGPPVAWRLLGGHRLCNLRTDPWRPYAVAPTSADDPAAIIFTTGSTGPPKGVLFRHAQFDAQVRILRDYFKIQPDEIDLPTFPLFALFDPALGMTAVIPDMDPTRPAWVDPRKIVAAICDQGVTHMFGSPALLDRVGRYGEVHEVSLPSLRRVISAGAPVPPSTLERFAAMLSPEAEIYTPYGATEALPVACIGHREILGETRQETEHGGGTCVGRPVPEADVRVIRITDEPIAEWSNDLVLPLGEIGEIVVKGPMVTREYCTSPEANTLAKIHERGGQTSGLSAIWERQISGLSSPTERSTEDVQTGGLHSPLQTGGLQSPCRSGGSLSPVWHRMGDVGHFDAGGRLWFCGRKSHRVVTRNGTLFSVPCEAIFNRHPAVFRSALVGLGAAPNQEPAICVELSDSKSVDEGQLFTQLRQLAESSTLTRNIHHFLIHPSFPVDIRHNSKISREKLAVWAAEELHDIKYK